MKKVLLLLLVSSFLFSFSTDDSQSDYCGGWENGYCEGWKDVKGQLSVCPVTPICPIPKVDCDTYKCGYNRGFKAGASAAYKN
jgi:hypothetical protein